MPVSLIPLKCPERRAPLQVEEGRSQVFCTYCGTKILIKNENEYVYRQIDEAGLVRAQTEQVMRLKELEMSERQQKHRHVVKSTLFYIWLASIVVVGVVVLSMGLLGGTEEAYTGLFCIGGPIVGGGAYLLFKLIPNKEAEKTVRANGGVMFPRDLGEFTEQHYDTVRGTLRSAGFTNVNCISMHDVKLGLFEKPGRIEKITVGGKQIMSGGRYYEPDVPITITYHGR